MSLNPIAQFFPKEKYFGLLFKKEIDNLKKSIILAQKPFTAIVGGAKITGKIDVLNSLVERVKRDKIDEVIIATSATVEGMTTAYYIKDSLKTLCGQCLYFIKDP